MASQKVIEFTDANFDTEVLSSATPVLVDFWAEWCMPCRMLGPTIDALADQYQGKAKVGKVDVDANRALSAKYGITAIPTVLLFREGKVVKQFLGLAQKEVLVRALDEATSAKA